MGEDAEVREAGADVQDRSEGLRRKDVLGPETRSAVNLLMVFAHVVGVFSALAVIVGVFALTGAGPFYGSTSWAGGPLLLSGAAGAVGGRLLGALSKALEELAERQAAIMSDRERHR